MERRIEHVVLVHDALATGEDPEWVDVWESQVLHGVLDTVHLVEQVAVVPARCAGVLKSAQELPAPPSRCRRAPCA